MTTPESPTPKEPKHIGDVTQMVPTPSPEEVERALALDAGDKLTRRHVDVLRSEVLRLREELGVEKARLKQQVEGHAKIIEDLYEAAGGSDAWPPEDGVVTIVKKLRFRSKMTAPGAMENLAKALGSPEAEELRFWAERAEKAEAALDEARKKIAEARAGAFEEGKHG